jgi:N-acetylmuramoyl-L-alanine amidase
MNRIQFLVIHCTATPAGREVSSDEIRHWHTDPKPKGNGWSQVGYTDLFHINGGIERLVANNEDANVDPWEITNGVAGKNSICRHIVYAGGMTIENKKPYDSRSWMQKESLRKYVVEFHRKNPDVKIVGHNYFDKGKACPSFDVQVWLLAIGIKQVL